MTENIKVRWLTDHEQTKVAPKTLSSQVFNEDGTLYKDAVNEALENKANKTDIIQADWNQNDESALDYVKNRTHWVEADGETYHSIDEKFLPETVATKTYVENLYQKLNSNTVLGFYCIEDVTIITNGNAKVYPANSNVQISFVEGDTFEIIPTSDNSILSLSAYPGTLGTFYSWLEGVKQFSNILFDMNDEAMYSKWSQGNQGSYQVQFAQYVNCIFWSDNPYISDVTRRTNYTLCSTAQLPLCYSTIPENTFKSFYLAMSVNSDPNWGNPLYKESFANANWATQAFSYYGARVIGFPGHDNPNFNITLPKDCRGLMFDARNIECAGTFDAINCTNFGAKSGSWREAFGDCISLKRLYIKNLKVSLNISWSPVDYDSISYIISKAINTNAIKISVSPYTYNLLKASDFELATSKNITIELITTNYDEDLRLSAIADKANQSDVLLKTEQALTEDELTQVRENLSLVGENTTGKSYTINGSSVTAGDHAEVFNNYEENIASGKYSHAEGYQSIAKGSYSHVEGYATFADGAASHAEGYDTRATARYAHAEGASTTASGNNSHAEGNNTTSSGHYSHAEGNFTTAAGAYSHAEGNYTQTEEDGTYAHAEGSYTKAANTGAHAEGNYTEANAAFAHTEGYYTKAGSPYQHVRGKYNIVDENNTYATIIGNGDADTNRKNIYTLDWDGGAWFSGDIYVGSTSGINKDDGSKKLATEEYADSLVENALLKTEQVLTDEELLQVRNNLKFVGKNLEGQTFTIDGEEKVAAASSEIFGDYDTNIAIGQWSIAEGSQTIAKGRASHAEGAMTQALNDGTHTEGYQTKATGFWSHAEGELTIVSSYASHAEGSYCTLPDGTRRFGTASGYASHVEGGGCHTTASCSHAEGLATTASGAQSHVEGRYTIAAGGAQHVEGIANIEDTNEQYIHIAGNGSWDQRSNAHTLDWQGNAWFSGDVYVGSTGGLNKDEGSAKLATESYVDGKVAQSITDDFIDQLCATTVTE